MKTFFTLAQKKQFDLAGTAYQKGRRGQNRTDEEIAAGAIVGPALVEALRVFGSRFSLVVEELTQYSIECERTERRKP
jgi:hypothetical protein